MAWLTNEQFGIGTLLGHGYASKANRQAARSRGVIPVIPHKANEKDKPGFFAKAIYKGRARIEQPRRLRYSSAHHGRGRHPAGLHPARP
jgi:hypothetical protein